METSPLDRPASIPVLRRLLTAGVLTPAEGKRLEISVREQFPWRLWLDRGLLSLGVILIISAVVYFFAHNLNLTDYDKLGLSAGAVLLALAGATWAGLDHFLGKLLLLAASILVGVFIAVFGQVYQSDAGTYQLFLLWAVLIFPWVLLGRFVPLWLFWLVLVNQAVGFYVATWSQDWTTTYRCNTLCLLAINVLALWARERAGWAKIPWVDRNWSAWLILTAVLCTATSETTQEIFGDWESVGVVVTVLVLHSLLTLGIVYYYGRVRPSLPALALATVSGCWVATIFASRIVFAELGFSDVFNSFGLWFVMGVLVLAIFGGGVYLLRLASRTIAH